MHILSIFISVLLLPISTNFEFNNKAKHTSPLLTTIADIDSQDVVILSFDQAVVVEDSIAEIPIFIESDDQINTLDFSMYVDTTQLEYLSIVDHTGDLQFAAFLNPDDLKLRFTSNSFSSYPKYPQKTISIRFKILGDRATSEFILDLRAFLNGQTCSAEIEGSVVSSVSTIITDQTFIFPNPASSYFNLRSSQAGTFQLLDINGRIIFHDRNIKIDGQYDYDTSGLPRGQYVARFQSKQNITYIQLISLQ